MKPPIYYNENDPYCAQWLRNLMAAGAIAPGEVDERSIVDVRAGDLAGFVQCHFFAGIGVWSYALRLAGWADARPVWTGSCPCQPFSDAGNKSGLDDERHLWPHLFRLALEQEPVALFGEQVANGDGLAWLDFVCADLEAAGYSVGAVDTCAAGFGAPHIRQRLYFVAHADGDRAAEHARKLPRDEIEHGERAAQSDHELVACGAAGSGAMVDAGGARLERHGGNVDHGDESGRLDAISARPIAEAGADGFMADDHEGGRAIEPSPRVHDYWQPRHDADRCGPVNGFWSDAEWIPCRDGKARPVEPGTFPLAHGASSRVGRLRAYGNAVNAEQAREFIAAYMQCRP